MALYRVGLLFNVTTNPTDTTTASPHSGSWSEELWTQSETGNIVDFITTLAQKRAALLPVGTQIIGYRQELFTISGNKLLPGGTNSGRLRFPGANGSINLPQDALQLSSTTGGGPNTSRHSLRAIPDGQISNGEFQPTPTFSAALATYMLEVANAGWGFIGRVRSNATARVLGIAGNVVTLSANIGGVANTTALRLLRVYDTAGNPVTGSFTIQLIEDNVYTLIGLTGHTVLVPSGNARIDQIGYFDIDLVFPSRAVSRKIGGPFEKYRGRASARR